MGAVTISVQTTALKLARLIDALLEEKWMRECEIIPEYMPPYPGPETTPRVVVKYKDRFLRHSLGPHQGFFWDIYGDDFIEPEWALLGISKAPCPFADYSDSKGNE